VNPADAAGAAARAHKLEPVVMIGGKGYGRGESPRSPRLTLRADKVRAAGSSAMREAFAATAGHGISNAARRSSGQMAAKASSRESAEPAAAHLSLVSVQAQVDPADHLVGRPCRDNATRLEFVSARPRALPGWIQHE